MDQPPQQPRFPQYPDPSQYGTQFPAQKTNGMAIASLISGILGLTMCAGVGSVFALIFGYISRSQIKRSQGTEGGSGMAMTGIILGWIGTILTILLFALLIGGAITLFNWSQSDGFEDTIDKGVGFIAKEALEDVDENDANCLPLEAHRSEGHKHIEEGKSVRYDSSPPTSAPHYEIPAQPGFYPADSDIEPERLVRNLERGQIVIWYRSDAVDLGFLEKQIETLVRQEPQATVGAPYEGLDAGINIVITSWRHARACANASQEVVDDFRREFQGKSPEPLTPAFKG